VLVARDWLADSVSLGRWRQRLRPRSFRVYYSWLHRFLMYAGMTPEEAVSWAARARKAGDESLILDRIQEFVLTQTRGRFKTKQLAYCSIRSFLMHNRVLLPQDPSFIIRGDEPPVERKLTIENLEEIVGLAAQPWRSAILVKWQALLDSEGLIYVSNNHAETIVKALRGNAESLKLTLPGRKRRRNERAFYTFIGHDALASLREYFERERGWPGPGEPVWVYSYNRKPIRTGGFEAAWLRLLRRARLIPRQPSKKHTTRYGYNAHNTRDLAISLLETVPGLNPNCAQFWAGHEIDPLGYNQFYNVKPEYVEEQYRLALPYLNIISGAKNPEQSRKEIEEMRGELKELKFAIRMLQDASGLVVRPVAGPEDEK